MVCMVPKASRSRHAGPRITVTFPLVDYDRVCVLARADFVIWPRSRIAARARPF